MTKALPLNKFKELGSCRQSKKWLDCKLSVH